MEFHASICRLCESPDQIGNSWVELFSDKNEHLLAKIHAFVNIAICANDGLPERICGRCNQNLEQAYDFKVRCEITDAKLRQEIDFLTKEGGNRRESIPPFNYSRFLLPQQGATEQNVTLAAEKVLVKAEPIEGEDFPSSTNKAETQLQFGQDWGPKECKDDASESEGFESKDDFSTDEMEKLPNESKPEEVRRNICDVCGEEFNNRKALIGHRRATHPKQRYRCNQCPRTFSERLYLEEHLAQHAGIRPYECLQCERKYFTKSGLSAHMKDHGDNLPFVCDKCGKDFATESKLRIHSAIHVETKNFICDVCNSGYKTLASLNSHKKTHLPRDQQRKPAPRKKKDYICQICGKISTHAGVHDMHMRRHTGDQRFECHVCSKRFTSHSSHKKHLLVHTGEKPHVCPYCQKAFRQRHHMNTHIRGVHTKETPYKCQFCERAFTTLGNMKEHEKSHGESDRNGDQQAPTVNPEQVFGHFLAGGY